MKKLLFALLISASSQLLLGQNVNYTIVRNAPDQIKPLKIEPFVFSDIWSPDITGGFGIKAEYIYANVFTVQASTRVGALSSTINLATEKILLPTMKEVVGYYHISDTKKSKSLNVGLSSSSSGGVTTSKYITVPADKRIVQSVRFGFYSNRAIVDLENNDPISGESKYGSPIYLNNPNNLIVPSISTTKTHMNSKVLIIGWSYRSITNLVIDVDGYRSKKANARIEDLYFDILFAPSIKYADVIIDNAVWTVANDNHKRLGWRIGYSYKSSSRSSITYGMEFGSRPGIKSFSTSFQMSAGWTIPFALGVKSVALQE